MYALSTSSPISDMSTSGQSDVNQLKVKRRNRKAAGLSNTDIEIELDKTSPSLMEISELESEREKSKNPPGGAVLVLQILNTPVKFVKDRYQFSARNCQNMIWINI